MHPGVVQIPQLRALVLRVPAMLVVAEREHPLLGPRLLLVAARAADRRVELALVQRLLQALGLHHVGVHGGAVGERADVLGDAVGVDVHAQFHSALGGAAVAERDHLAKLPARIHMQQRDRRRRRRERLQQQMQQHRTVLADRIQQHRIAELGGHLAQDVDALGLEPVEVGQGGRMHRGQRKTHWKGNVPRVAATAATGAGSV